ncbi:FlaD/FlaE family flagellar protein [Haloglomus salinum]|uniref:FlaD/FlaE family flagellar protein n=1 Tax=Haloglomus salinum TaxID=2962673 RepID=UPI0020C9477F|nr:FlaD/FlaE family flagellar protein [Haloglomus salinum]
MGLFGGGDEEEDTADEEPEEASDPLLDDGGDDLLEGGEDMAFGDMDDDDGGGGGGGAGNAELENRMDELENEVGSLSSTVNTVKSENEQISESVDDIEENIRKLLEVYEMVTRGVNPFVNEDDLGNAFDGGGGAAGGGASLFGGDDGGEDEEALDDDVAGADAEDFFDEDLGEDEFDDGMGEFDDGDDEFGGGGDDFDDDADALDGGMDDFDDSGDADGDEGKSFEELKAEYDAGDAEWQGEEADAGEPLDAPDAEPAAMDGDGMEGALDEDMGRGGPEADEAFDTEGLDEVVADDAGATTTDTAASDHSDGRRPHLDALPDGYASDVVVMEWLEFLVDQGGVDGAARTIAYYESIGWLGEAAAEDLQTYLGGFGEAAAEDLPDPEPVEARSPLSVQCHRTSLRYVSRLSSASMGMDVMDRLEEGNAAHAPAPDARSSRPDWLAGNGHDSAAPAAPAAEAAGGPATDGGTDPGDGRAPTWQQPPESRAVGSEGGHDPAPEERLTRARGADDGPPPGGRRGVERTGAEAPTPESTDDPTDQ